MDKSIPSALGTTSPSRHANGKLRVLATLLFVFVGADAKHWDNSLPLHISLQQEFKAGPCER